MNVFISRRIGILLIVALMVAGGGLLFVNQIMKAFDGIKVEESIVVDRSVEDTFAFVTAVSNSEKISEHIVDVEQLGEGNNYKRTLLIHGNPNTQEVIALVASNNSQFITTTELYGFNIVYTYQLSQYEEAATLVALTKEASQQGFWKVLMPLIKHLLTRPEHDGQHLATLKTAVEAQTD